MTVPLGLSLPGFYPAVCPGKCSASPGLRLSDQAPQSGRNPRRIRSIADCVPSAEWRGSRRDHWRGEDRRSLYGQRLLTKCIRRGILPAARRTIL